MPVVAERLPLEADDSDLGAALPHIALQVPASPPLEQPNSNTWSPTQPPATSLVLFSSSACSEEPRAASREPLAVCSAVLVLGVPRPYLHLLPILHQGGTPCPWH